MQRRAPQLYRLGVDRPPGQAPQDAGRAAGDEPDGLREVPGQPNRVERGGVQHAGREPPLGGLPGLPVCDRRGQHGPVAGLECHPVCDGGPGGFRVDRGGHQLGVYDLVRLRVYDLVRFGGAGGPPS
ncbi:MAG: hypothetical protein GEV09_23510 [Pseudonocardiaceae bacterium]|nr:hypothetical protein [Pseudonocardiaceae bacterium]